jgi:hypothetical protein
VTAVYAELTHAGSNFLSLEESIGAAQRLFDASRPIFATLGENYLRERGISEWRQTAALRFHPKCFYRAGSDGNHAKHPETWPAMIACVIDLDGIITATHRTWLDPSGRWKAPVDTPRRSMGHLLGNRVRFGVVADVMAAGEGIETILSLRCVMPRMP